MPSGVVVSVLLFDLQVGQAGGQAGQFGSQLLAVRVVSVGPPVERGDDGGDGLARCGDLLAEFFVAEGGESGCAGRRGGGRLGRFSCGVG